MNHILTYEQYLKENWLGNAWHADLKPGAIEVAEKGIFWHGSTDEDLKGKRGLHVGTKEAATQALEARIGIPAEGKWDGTREYGKTLLAGKRSLKGRCTGFNCGKDVPEDDYYPASREERATYSDGSLIPLDSKPIVFAVKIVGKMTNTPRTAHDDTMANSMIMRALKRGNAKSGFFYINDGEDEGSISAVVPDSTFLRKV